MKRSRNLLLACVLAGCGGSAVAPNEAARQAETAGGLEHVLEVSTSPGAEFTDFTLRSSLRNGGDEPVTVRVRSCYLRSEDVRGEREALRLYEPLMLCAEAERIETLAPGETGAALELTGRGPAGGIFPLELRHALAPEHWTPLTLALP